MNYKSMTKAQLVDILVNLDQRCVELEKELAEHKQNCAELKLVEEKLRNAQRQTQDIIDFLPDATFVIDQNGKVIAWNRAIEEMTGVNRADMIGKGDYAYAIPFYGKPRPILIDLVNAGIREAEYDHIEKKGGILYGEVFVPSIYKGKGAILRGTASPLFDSEGNLIGAIESIRDVTEKRTFENELQASRERYRALYEAVGCGVLVRGADGRLIEGNLFAEEILGLSSTDLFGRSNFHSILNSIREDGTPFKDDEFPGIKALKSGKTVRGAVMGLYNKLKGQVWIQINSVPLFRGDGRVEGSVTTFMDITARKNVEAELANRKELLEQIMYTAEAVILVLDPNGGIISANRFVERLTGYIEDELKGRNITEFIPENNVYETMKVFKDAMGGNILSGYENLILTKYGREVRMRWYFSLLRDATGRVTAGLAIGHDITELRSVEAQLLQAQKMEAIGRLAGGIAHDFNNLLTCIMGNISLASKEFFPGTIQELLAEAELAAKRAAEITGQLLGFSRKTMLQPRPLNINSCVTETVAILRRTFNPRIIIETRLKPDLWLVQADPAQITQVLMNLCLNARDAMPDGGTILIETTNIVLEQAKINTANSRVGEFVMFSVSDTGSGMPHEIQERIFEPFFTTKEPGRGSGLGLSTVYGIVRQQEGWIECFSEVDRGTRFTVYLPRYTSDVFDQTNLTPHPDAFFRGHETILVVDDEEMVRNLVEKILSHYGYKVLTAGDGRTALKLYRRKKNIIGLVLLDLTMPGLSGRDTLTALKKINPNVKVLLSSGYSLNHPGEELPAAEAAGFVKKPYRANELALAVRKTLDL